jgi:hypothetical protein
LTVVLHLQHRSSFSLKKTTTHSQNTSLLAVAEKQDLSATHEEAPSTPVHDTPFAKREAAQTKEVYNVSFT